MSRAKVKLLKQNNEDFEWYPTTDEILSVIQNDLIKSCTVDSWNANMRGSDIKFERSYREEQNRIHIDSFLDVGAGDGRVLDFMRGDKKTNIFIKNKLGIELAKAQGDDLIKRGVGLIGRDYFETTLIDKKFDVVFSNPPYSNFKEWCVKLLKEVNACFVYLVIPARWSNDSHFKAIVEQKGDITILGGFGFKEGDREARANVEVIKIANIKGDDTFTAWVEENISSFEANKEEVEEIEEVYGSKAIEQRSENVVSVLVENYNNEMMNLMDTYSKLGSIDFKIIQQLGVCKSDVLLKIKTDIAALKHLYWHKTFNTLESITSRLTYSKRVSILEEIKWFESLDFNKNNVYTIIIWVIENYNRYTKEQLQKVYKDLTDFENVRAYKSNDVWNNDNWRYNKPTPTKYALDYRIVVPIGYRISKYKWDLDDNPIKDLSVVAETLGFKNDGIPSYDIGDKHNCMDGNDVLFEYKIYKNGNVHFKLEKKFIQTLNIEVGKLNGWIKKPQDIQDEFELKKEDAIKYFTKSELMLLGAEDSSFLLESLPVEGRVAG